MDLSGAHFEYAGVSSREYDLVFAHVDTSPFLNLDGSIQSTTAFSKRNMRMYYLGNTYHDSPITFDAEVVDDDADPIPALTRKIIERWLFNRRGYAKLYIDMTDDHLSEMYELIDDVPKRTYINCRFVSPVKIESGDGIIGYRFTVECDSCIGWQDETVFETELDGGGDFSSIQTVNVSTDLDEYIYPKVTFVTGSVGGNVTISNNSDDSTRLTSFTGLSPNTQVVMNGELNYISGQNYQKFSGKNFIRFLNGDNSISIIGDVTSISFNWQNRRYI